SDKGHPDDHQEEKKSDQGSLVSHKTAKGVPPKTGPPPPGDRTAGNRPRQRKRLEKVRCDLGRSHLRSLLHSGNPNPGIDNAVEDIDDENADREQKGIK